MSNWQCPDCDSFNPETVDDCLTCGSHRTGNPEAVDGTPEAYEVECPNCEGNNPPTRRRCQWCATVFLTRCSQTTPRLRFPLAASPARAPETAQACVSMLRPRHRPRERGVHSQQRLPPPLPPPLRTPPHDPPRRLQGIRRGRSCPCPPKRRSWRQQSENLTLTRHGLAIFAAS